MMRRESAAAAPALRAKPSDPAADDPRCPAPADSPASEVRVSALPTILLVEDNAGDVLLLREAMNENGLNCHLVVIADGEDAMVYVNELEKSDAGRPALIILDLNVPKRSGREILARLRAAPVWADTPIVILSSSEAADDRQYAAAMGASLYIRKPLDLEEFMAIGGVLRRMLERQKDATA